MARYVAYTDDTFTARKPLTPRWEHAAFLGPVIRAEVGDVIKVVFRNHARFPFSLHPAGVRGDKANEGANYNDGGGRYWRDDTRAPLGLGQRTCSGSLWDWVRWGCSPNEVKAGEQFTYTWSVTEDA